MNITWAINKVVSEEPQEDETLLNRVGDNSIK